MKRSFRICILICMMSCLAALSTNAAGWNLTEKGIWQYHNEDGSLLKSGWYWLDGNKDGIAECYCFSPEGNMYADCITPDNWRVNADGAWIENGIVQTIKQPGNLSFVSSAGSAETTGSGSFAESSSSGGSSSSSGSSGASSDSGSGSGADSGSSESADTEKEQEDDKPVTFKITISISANITTVDQEKKQLSGSKSITVEEDCGYTAYDALCELCDDLAYEIEGDGDYVSSIGGLAEFEGGAMSGWMYSVNGKYPNVCCGNYEVRKGDRISWVYVTSMRETTDV